MALTLLCLPHRQTLNRRMDIEQLEAEARRLALQQVANMLQRPDQLEKVDQYKQRYDATGLRHTPQYTGAVCCPWTDLVYISFENFMASICKLPGLLSLYCDIVIFIQKSHVKSCI